jgi:hypothetical protein
MCYTFDVAKCDRIFDYLLQEKQIKLLSNHVILSLEKIQKHAYCTLTSLNVIGSLISCCRKNKLNCHVIMLYCHWNKFKSMLIVNGIIPILILLIIVIFFIDRFNWPQIKLDKDPFPTIMNMVELDGKKVLVQPSQAKSTKDKEVVIGEEWKSRMIKPKSLKDDQ